MWPASSVDPAHIISSVLVLNPARVLPPNALKDEQLFSRWEGFSRTLIVDGSITLTDALTLNGSLTLDPFGH